MRIHDFKNGIRVEQRKIVEGNDGMERGKPFTSRL